MPPWRRSEGPKTKRGARWSKTQAARPPVLKYNHKYMACQVLG